MVARNPARGDAREKAIIATARSRTAAKPGIPAIGFAARFG
jgi:hypothetical protein